MRNGITSKMISKSIDPGQPARTAQADLVDTFCKHIKLLFSQSIIHIYTNHHI